MPALNPKFAAFVPPMLSVSVSFLPLMTSWPLLLSHAATCALPKTFLLMALSRSPTVSLPVDLYVVVLVPSLTVNVPLAMIPSVASEVLAVSGAVPVPTAGAAAVALELDVPEELELGDDEEEDGDVLEDDELLDEPAPLVPLDPPSMDARALCTAAVSWLLTRLRALSLAMLDKPLDNVVDAPNIKLMTALFWAIDAELLAAWLQKLWSC